MSRLIHIVLVFVSYFWRHIQNWQINSSDEMLDSENFIQWMYLFLGNIRHTLDMRAQLPKYNIPNVAYSDFANKKNSDTLFVFGSGPTINDLRPCDFEYIHKHDSLGFNYFLVHDFVPDFYCYETPANYALYDFFCSVLNEKQEYDSVPLVIQFQHFEKRGFDISKVRTDIRPVYFVVPYRYRTISETRLRKLLYLRKWLTILSPFTLNSVIHHGGSISYIVTMAYAMGYQTIILLGVDMYNTEYFFTELPDNSYKKDLVDLFERIRAGRLVFTHNDPQFTKKFGELPPDIFLRLFNEIFLIPDGVKLYVGSEKSRLATFLPVFSFPG